MSTEPIKQCIRLSKNIRLKHQYNKLISIKKLTESYDFKFSTLPLMLFILLLHIVYHVIVNASRLFSIAVELPLTPKDKSFYTFWLLHGLSGEYSNATRLGLLKQWLEMLYPGKYLDAEVDNGINELLEGRCNASKADILASYMDSIDYVVRDMDLELQDE